MERDLSIYQVIKIGYRRWILQICMLSYINLNFNGNIYIDLLNNYSQPKLHNFQQIHKYEQVVRLQ